MENREVERKSGECRGEKNLMIIIIIILTEKVRYVPHGPPKLLMLVVVRYYDDDDVWFVVCVGSQEYCWMVHNVLGFTDDGVSVVRQEDVDIK